MILCGSKSKFRIFSVCVTSVAHTFLFYRKLLVSGRRKGVIKYDAVCVDKIHNQRDYFCFYDYEYVFDVTEQSKLMPNTESLEQGLKEEFDWYKNNTDSVYNRKPYIDYIDKNL